jgi:NAD(P)-dependent dehydrogenase (short-subunit alcohol dehydrogenase family)
MSNLIQSGPANKLLGTAGLGEQTVLLLAEHKPEHIIFTGRSLSRAEGLTAALQSKFPSVRSSFISLDLASLASVQAGAKAVLSLTTRLDILICNAGIMAVPPALTIDGYELQFGTNHLGHALLTKLLLPTMISTAKLPGTDIRVVFLSSEAFQGHPVGGIIFSDLKTTQDYKIMGRWARYGQSKLANILYASELARKYSDSGVTFLSIHPGVFNTGLIKDLPWPQRAFIWVGNAGRVKDEKVQGQGAWNTCWAATGPKSDVVNGSFYYPVGVKGKKWRDNENEVLAGNLWDWTEKELEKWY